MIKWSWTITSFSLAGRSHDEIIELCRHAGVASVEAKNSFVAGKTEGQIEDLRQLYSDGGVTCDSFHLPLGADDDIASFYETTRVKALDNMLSMIGKAKLLGSRVVILHPTTSRFSVEAEGMDGFLRQMGKSLEKILPRAEELGIMIAVENMPPAADGGFRLGAHPDHFALFSEKFAHPCLAYCFDTGHAQLAEGAVGPSRMISAMGSRLNSFHLHDNSGDRDLHIAPGRGLIDWKVIFRAMRDSGFAAPACIEASPFNYGLNGRHSPDAWKILIEETTALAEKCLASGGSGRPL